MRDRNFDLAVREAVSKLPFAQANAVWLVDVCGASYAQVGDEIGAERRIVTHHVNCARLAIRDHLKRSGAVSVDPIARSKRHHGERNGVRP